MRYVLIANGEIKDLKWLNREIKSDDIIICVDGGLIYAEKAKIFPNVIIGDFDSIDVDVLNTYKKKGSKIIKFPIEKDYTDLELAIEIATNEKPDNILIFGALGKRYDHAIANIMNLKKILDLGLKGCIRGEKEDIYLINKEKTFDNLIGQTISLIPLSSEVKGVTTKGCKYPLNDEKLEIGFSRGVSNIVETSFAKVEVREGILIVIVNKKV